jgi:hypothetical protein
MAKSREFLYQLSDYAWEYINECEGKTEEKLSNKGTIADVKLRQIPTIDYFLNIWIPKHKGKSDTIKRQSYYRWLHWENTEKQRVIKSIDELFKALAADIVANEGKGIFYAKNKLGWTDKRENKETGNATTIINLGSGIKPDETTD